MNASYFRSSARHKGRLRSSLLAIILYADGMSASDVAIVLGRTVLGTRSSIRAQKERYRKLGIDAGSKTALRQALVDDGFLAHEWSRG